MQKPKGAYAKNGIWHARFRFRSREYRPSTGLRVGEAARREVEAAVRRLRADVEAGAAPARGRDDGPFLAELAAADQKHARSSGYTGAIASMWRTLLGHFGDAALSSIDYDSVQEYERARRAGGVVPLPVPPKPGKKSRPAKPRAPARGQTIREEIDCLKRAFDIAKRRKLVDVVPGDADWPEIKSDAPHETKRGRLVHAKHLAALLREIPGDVREALWFDVLTGLRFEELHRVTAAWVREDLDSGRAYLLAPADGTKDREERTIALSRGAAAIAAKRITEAKGRGEPLAVLFPKVDRRKALASACARAGLSTHVTYRDLRTTFANLARRSGSGTAAMALMGHADERTLGIYLRHDIAEQLATVDAIEAALSGHLEVGTVPSGVDAGNAKPPEDVRGGLQHSGCSTESGRRDSNSRPFGPEPMATELKACPCCVHRCQALHGSAENGSVSHACPPEVGTKGGHYERKRRKAA